jgi:ABC-type multidrug transport system fused ATPase/permease subunit
MEPTIFKFVLRHSYRQQILLSLLAAASFPFLYAFYEVPKAIVNDAIQGGATFPVTVFGVELSQFSYLLALCGVFLLLVVVNQGFKYYVNVFRGLTGERMLRRLRYDLYARVLRFPLPTFRKVSQGEIIPMITAEVEPLGGFIGDAFSLPAFQGGTLIVILTFLFIQDPIMAAAAVSLYPLQVYIIPKLQRRVNLLGKERVRLVRRLSDRIGETVQGVSEIHIHDTSNFALANFSHQLGAIFDVRYAIYRQKFFIKFLNNFIQQLGPFFFYSIGGYLTISGQLEIGTLIAAIAAHKDLASPWKELLRYYQLKEDARIKYDQVVGQFDPPGILGANYQLDEPETVAPLTGEFNVANLTLTDDQDNSVVDGISFRISLDQHVALVGPHGSGTEDLTLLLARLLDPSNGTIAVNGADLAGLPEAVTGRRISYVGPQGFVFATTLGENLFYGLKHRPLVAPDYDDAAEARRKAEAAEAARSGNIDYDVGADWVDYKAAGVADLDALRSEGLRVLKLVDLGQDVYQLGLRGTIDPKTQPDVAAGILSARRALRERAAKDPTIASLIETFDRERYNTNATVGENLLFGNPVGEHFAMDNLADDDYVLSVLDQVGLRETMLSIGYQVAATMVELFADLPPDHEFFQQFGFISSEDLPEFQALLTRVDRDHLGELGSEDRARLMSLPFKLIPARHRLGLIDAEMQAKVLEARRAFAANLPEELRDAVEFYDAEAYNSSANLQDNILFGKAAYGEARAADRVGRLVAEVIEGLGLEDMVGMVAIDYDVGIAGSRLSGSQRQKLAIARAILKRPDVLILSEPTAALDTAAQSRIPPALLEEFKGRCVVWALHRPSLAENFDHIVVMRNGKVAEQGSYADLNRDGTEFHGMLAAE